MTGANVISFSGGKDSTAMLLAMLEHGEKIHSVVWFDTEREFPEIIEHIKRVISDTGVRFQRIRHWAGFDFLEERYGDPHKSGGWCTAAKRNCCNKYMRLIRNDLAKAGETMFECIGFAFDEVERTEKGELAKKPWHVRFPLIEYGMTEADALTFCYERGYRFGELYEWMPSKRVSCFDCIKQSKPDIAAIKYHCPALVANSRRKIWTK